MPEVFKTIQRVGEAEIVIKKSRFIGRCFPVNSEQEAAARLDEVKKAFWDARHNCYAWRIGSGVLSTRSSDDGEPSGTAGAPILNVLVRQELINVLCVVTRYFGGVLLGAGGLIRAYTDACSQSAADAGIVFMRSCTAYDMTVPYPLFAAVENVAAAFGGFCDTDFTDSVRARIWIRDEQREVFLDRIRNSTDARVRPEAVESGVRPFAS